MFCRHLICKIPLNSNHSPMRWRLIISKLHTRSAPEEKFDEVTQTAGLHYDHMASCESSTEVQPMSGSTGPQKWVFIPPEFALTSYAATAS